MRKDYVMKKYISFIFLLSTLFLLVSCGSRVPSRCANCGDSLDGWWEECTICGKIICDECYDFGLEIYLESYFADYLDSHPYALEDYLSSRGYDLVKVN